MLVVIQIRSALSLKIFMKREYSCCSISTSLHVAVQDWDPTTDLMIERGSLNRASGSGPILLIAAAEEWDPTDD